MVVGGQEVWLLRSWSHCMKCKTVICNKSCKFCSSALHYFSAVQKPPIWYRICHTLNCTLPLLCWKIILLIIDIYLHSILAPSPPRITQISNRTDTMLQLQWERPAQPNGRLLGYNVFCKPKDGNQTLMYVVEEKNDESMPSFTIYALSEYYS